MKPFNKNKKIKDFVEANSKPKIIVNAPVIIATSFGLLNLSARKPVIGWVAIANKAAAEVINEISVAEQLFQADKTEWIQENIAHENRTSHFLRSLVDITSLFEHVWPSKYFWCFDFITEIF